MKGLLWGVVCVGVAFVASQFAAASCNNPECLITSVLLNKPNQDASQRSCRKYDFGIAWNIYALDNLDGDVGGFANVPYEIMESCTIDCHSTYGTFGATPVGWHKAAPDNAAVLTTGLTSGEFEYCGCYDT
jgi:hypothetical protein